ncbi:MAG: glycosyltransferase [Candidatus Methanoperedens sp.]|nr:glycosyltransferase [Candidatus Methanoperedens sp.]
MKPKLIYTIHVFSLTCPTGGLYCVVLNKFLKEPLTCLNCLGYIGIKTGGDNLKRWHKLAQRADAIAVDSEFMMEFYHTYNPTLLPLPMETDLLIPCDDKEDYIFYTGRLSFEKNPYGFIDIVNKTGLKGKMAVYDTIEDILGVRSHYKELLENKNIEIFFGPSKEKMIDLVRHARFTVLPYFFAEPFGVAAANSVLCGTPLITFPYGNLRSFTKLLPNTLDEMIQLIKMDDERYRHELKETIKRSNELRDIHKPENAIKKWDEMYDSVGSK